MRVTALLCVHEVREKHPECLAPVAPFGKRPANTGVMEGVSDGPDITGGWNGSRCLECVEGVHIGGVHARPLGPVPLLY